MMTTATPATATVIGPATIDASGVFDYAGAPEGVKPKLKDKYGLFIGGGFVDPADGKHFATINPANEETIAEVAMASMNDVALYGDTTCRTVWKHPFFQLCPLQYW